MTTYLGDKAVGIGTVKATKAVAGDVLHDETLVGNGNTEPLGVDKQVIATTNQVGNLATTLHAAIEAQADAIAKTRNDMNEKDSELESILNEHAEELTTLRGNQASLGDQVSGIEEKIPGDASATNQLATKADLKSIDLDDYVKKSGDTMTGDLAFEDYSAAHPQKHVLHGDSSFSIEYYYNNEQHPRQTWNFAGASFFASSTTGVKPFLGHPVRPWDNIYAKKLNNGADVTIPSEGGTLARVEDLTDLQDALDAKQDTLTAGDGISIEGGVISNTRTNAEWGNITGDLNNQTDLQNALGTKQDKLTAGANITISDDNIISSTAQESFFRGTWKNWNSVSTNPEAYAVDYHGNKTPKENDYIVVQDTSDYRPGYNRPITVKVVSTAWGQLAWTLSIDGGESFTVPRSASVVEKDYQGFKLVFTSTYDQVSVSATVDTVYESNLVVAGETIFIIPVRAETDTEYVSYWGGSDIEYQGSWRFSYHGVWETDNKNGWVAEYQIEETLPIADETQMGIAKLYTTTGSNEDGAMTQKAITENTTRVIIRRWE